MVHIAVGGAPWRVERWLADANFRTSDERAGRARLAEHDAENSRRNESRPLFGLSIVSVYVVLV